MKNILFSKTNYSRKKEFLIITSLIDNKNNFFIRKEIAYKEGKNFLNSISNNHSLIKKKLINIKPVKILAKKNNYIDFEYLNHSTLFSLIEKNLIERNFYKTEKYLNLFINLIKKQKILTYDLSKNALFNKIFNPYNEIKFNKEKCLNLGIIDFNLENIVFNEKSNKFYLIDWEWTFDFPISLNFILFRSVYYLSAHLQLIIKTYCSESFPCIEILKDFYIPKIFFKKIKFLTPSLLKKYLMMENNFQNYVNYVEFKIKKSIFIKKFNLKKEKILINKLDNLKNQINTLTSQNIQLSQQLNNLNSQLSEYFSLKSQLEQTRAHIQNLETQLNTIKSAKFFKLWQGYCKIMKLLKLKS